MGARDHYIRALEYWREHRLEEAERDCRAALVEQPDYPDAVALLAEILLTTGSAQFAVMLAERAASASPDDPAARRLLGRALIAVGRPQDALSVLAEDEWAEQFARGATLLYASGQPDEAERVVARGLLLQPDEPELTHLHAAFSGARLDRASDEYVVRHFDRFASTFDERLRAIGYSLPDLVPAALSRALGGKRVAVLDAGCGTGMLGDGLRPLAPRLVGVDLSPRMLDRARTKGCYDELVESELVAWLSTTDETFGAAVAADLLIYFGAIEALVAGLARVVMPDGLTVLSIEVAGHGEHALTPSGRFSHDPRYVDAVLCSSGFEPVARDECVLRVQGGENVAGMIVSARRVAT